MQKENYITRKSLDAIMYDDYESNKSNKNKKESLIDNEHAVWDQNFQLENAKRSAFEIEDMSNNVARNLDSQTNQMKNIKGRQLQLEENLDQGDFFIESMENQERKKKRYMTILGILLIVIFLGIVLMRIF